MNRNINTEDISLSEIFSILYKRKKMFLSTLILTLIIVIVLSSVPPFKQNKQFEAVSGIAVTYEYKAPINEEGIGEGYVYYQDRLSNNSIVTIKSYLQSRTILRSVIEELDLKDSKGKRISVKALKKLIKIEEQPGSNLISITVEYKDEKKTAEIANLIPKKIIQMTNANSDLINYNILIIDEAIAYEKTESNIPLVVLVGIGLGLIFALAVVYIKELSSDRILSKSELYRQGMIVEEEFSSISTTLWQSIINGALISNANSITVGFGTDFDVSSINNFIELLENSNCNLVVNNYLENTIIKTDKQTLRVNDFSFLNKKSINEIIFLVKEQNLNNQENLNINLIEYKSSIFPQVAYLSNKTTIIIEEEKTSKKDIEKIKFMEDKYGLDLTMLYIVS
ncbi:YveK family protein [Acetoanaerobium noterae]|uniref:YveK family protein n=1 Tax=Acetoanaerobium noterae TaxID=745369 RepID=UPI00334043CF